MYVRRNKIYFAFSKTYSIKIYFYNFARTCGARTQTSEQIVEIFELSYFYQKRSKDAIAKFC